MKNKLVFKIASLSDIDILADMRIRFLLELHPEYQSDKACNEQARKAIKDYFSKNIENKTCVVFLGLLHNMPVCSAGVLIYEPAFYR